MTLSWRHNGRVGVSDHQPHHCLLNHLFRRRSWKISKPRVTGLCVGNSPVTGEFPAQKASNAKMFPFDDVIMKYALGFCWSCLLVVIWQSHWPLGDVILIDNYILQANVMDYVHWHFLWICPLVNVTEHVLWYVNPGSGNGLVSSRNTFLSEPIMTQIDVTTWRHWAAMNY